MASDLSRVEAIVFAAVDKPTAAARTSYVKSACAGDEQLRRHVERLLEAGGRLEPSRHAAASCQAPHQPLSQFAHRHILATTAITIALVLVVAGIVCSLYWVQYVESTQSVWPRRVGVEGRHTPPVDHESTVIVLPGRLSNGNLNSPQQTVADLERALDIVGATLDTHDASKNEDRNKAIAQMLFELDRRLDANDSGNRRVEAYVRPLIGKAYWSAGRLKEATDQFRQAVLAQRLTVGIVNERVAETLVWLAICCDETGALNDAERYMTESVNGWDKTPESEGTLPYLRLPSHITDSLLQAGRARQALRFSESAVAVLRRTCGVAYPETGRCVVQLADAHAALGNTSELITQLRKAQAIFAYAGNLDGQWQALMQLGQAQSRQHDLAAAQDAFRRAREISRRLPAKSIERLHTATMSLSEVLLQSRDWAGIESIHLDFLRAAEAHMWRYDPRLAEHRAALVGTLTAQGRQQEASAMQHALLAVATPATARDLYGQLGNTLREYGLHEQAKAISQQAQERAAKTLPHDLNWQSAATQDLAHILLDLRDYCGAEQQLRSFLGQASASLAQDDTRVLGSQRLLALALLEQQKSSEAIALWQNIATALKGAADRSTTLWDPQTDRLVYLEAISMSDDNADHLQAAAQSLQQLQPVITGNESQEHWLHAIAARLNQQLNKSESAIADARAAVEHTEPVIDFCRHHELQSRLVQLLSEAGQSKEAEAVLRQELTEQEARFGGHNLMTCFARADLAELLVREQKYQAAQNLLAQAHEVILQHPLVAASQKQHVVRLMITVFESTDMPDLATSWRCRLDNMSLAPY